MICKIFILNIVNFVQKDFFDIEYNNIFFSHYFLFLSVKEEEILQIFLVIIVC